MRVAWGIGVTVLLAAWAARDVGAQTGPRGVDLATASPRVTAAVARATQAIQELQTTLLGRLTGAMAEGGPSAAVRVCRDEATNLSAGVGAKHGAAIGRTSHRLRNPQNAARAWAAPTVASHAGRKVVEAQPAVFDLGGKVGVLRPIGTIEMCLTCHGPQETVDAAIGPVLKASYPQDQATGFAVGDLRGWIWVEVE